jgi:Flp pilus assembly protein TadB
MFARIVICDVVFRLIMFPDSVGRSQVSRQDSETGAYHRKSYSALTGVVLVLVVVVVVVVVVTVAVIVVCAVVVYCCCCYPLW